MYYIRDMRASEIAALLGISIKTVRRHIEIAVRELKMDVKKGGEQMYMINLLLPLLWCQLTSL